MKYFKPVSILILLIILKRAILASENSVFIVTKQHCITNSPSAIAFNTSITKGENVNQMSSFFPLPPGENIACNIEYNEQCTNSFWITRDWRLESSIEGPINQLITDWRWEALQLYKTEYVDNDGETMEFKQVFSFNKREFEIPISIRITKDAHIFLCDGSHPSVSNCYWIMLQAFKGKKSAVRKCSSGKIPSKYGTWPKPPCSISITEKEHGKGEKILSEFFWSHFKIERKSDTMTIKRGNQEVLKFSDYDFIPKFMFIHSKDVNGLWKLHTYNYIYKTEKGTDQLGPEYILLEVGQHCVSLFVVMCSKCMLKFRLVDYQNMRNIYAKNFTTEDEKWTEIKILINTATREQVKLFVTTYSEEISGLFWAIDHVRLCNEREYRILESPSLNLACQMIENENSLQFAKVEGNRINELDTDCPENTFGKDCVPCQIFGNSLCRSFKYCESFNTNEEKCFCTPGYISENCEQACSSHMYGHGCKKDCEHCYLGCDNVVGYCKSQQCTDDFKGNKCDIPPQSLLKYPPKVFNIKPNSCTVQITDFDIIGDDEPKFYIIQYKKKFEQGQWLTVNEIYQFYNNPAIAIDNLEPETEYYVRAAVYTSRHNLYQGDALKKETFRTPCNSIQPDEIIIAPKDTSVTVTLKPNIDTCQIYNYEYSIESSVSKTRAKQFIEIGGLKPFKGYRLTLLHVSTRQEIYKSFYTEQGVPSKVKELKAIYRLSTSIHLQWKEPEEKNGNILHYTIQYRLIKGKSCSPRYYSRYEEITEEGTNTVVEGLNPYSLYEIRVCAVTVAGPGEYFSIEVETEQAEDLSENEVLKIKNIKTTGTEVTVFFNTLDCHNIRGPIYLFFSAKCENEWCHEPEPSTYVYDINSPVVTENGLSPYVNYTLDMQISHSMDWSKARRITDRVTTKPTYPNFIQDVTVTSKDENSFSLRWKPPYPPTGILKKYKIKYETTSFIRTYKYKEEVVPTNCKLWPHFHCASIILEERSKGWVYNIEILATNEVPCRFVKVTQKSIAVKAITAEPESPYELTGSWTSNNDLQISWKHPNATNGLLTKFEINLSNHNRNSEQLNFLKVINSENDYNLTYTYQVKQPALEPCSEYSITVVAHNRDYESVAAKFEGSTPPPIPSLMSKEDLKTRSRNHSITIDIPRYMKKKKTTSEILDIFKKPESSTVDRQPPRNKKDDEIPLTDQQPTNNVSTIKPMVKPRISVAGIVLPAVKTTHSKPIKINDFELYVKESIENGELERQHGLFPRGQTKPWEYGALKTNKSKNRYNNLIAYDHTRVKLSKIEGTEHSDYINASYIDGYRTARAYIATQGPKAATLNDFWRMIWQEKVKHIIMLANIYENGKKKVEKYWPDINEDRDFDGIRVQYVSTEVFANYEFRVFNVCKKNVQRKIEQLHFTSWPDHGVPLYSQSLVPFLQKILKIPNKSNSPVVVHCSAGVGRTGTIILCDICLRMAAGEGSIDFLANLENIRSQRANMVDNVDQYKLAHLVVLECLFGMHTSIPCNEHMDKDIEALLQSNVIKAQLKYLADTEWQDKAMDTTWDVEEVPINTDKDRFVDIVPEQQHQIYLARYPLQDGRSSYINAIQVDGFRNPGRYIVTQQPMPNTLGDFWRLVAERKSTLIISLNEINQDDETSCQFWPEKDTEINPVDYLKICHVSSTFLTCYRIITLRVINQKENENVSVNIISMNNWMPNDLLPNSIEEYLSFWEESDALARQSDPVIITCYNGAKASGLYIATSFIIEKMKLEQECDVCQAVRSIRHNRRQFVTSEEQFEFLYRASLMYINGFQAYANFT